MIFVAGVSTSGKTHTLAALAELLPGTIVLSASGLLAGAGRPLRPLTPVQALANQQVLADELERRGTPRDAILDGHAMVETTEGPLPVPDEWYDMVGLDGFVMVEAAPEVIAERRRIRGLPWTAEDAWREQEAERAAVHRQAARLRAPALDLPTGDVERLASWLAEVSQGRRVADGR